MLPFELEAPGEAFAGAMATCPWWERRRPTSSTREGSDAMAREVLGSFGRFDQHTWDVLGYDAQPTSININQHQLASIRSEPTFLWEKMLKDNYSTRPHAAFATSGYMLQGAHWFWGWWFLFI